MGLTVSEEGINRGYVVADVFFNRENEIRPLAERSEGERSEFFANYEQMILENAGVPVSLDLANQIWKLAISVPKDFIPFDDVIPTLARLHDQGYQLGVLSNLRRDMSELCRRLGLAPRARWLQALLRSCPVWRRKGLWPVINAERPAVQLCSP